MRTFGVELHKIQLYRAVSVIGLAGIAGITVIANINAHTDQSSDSKLDEAAAEVKQNAEKYHSRSGDGKEAVDAAKEWNAENSDVLISVETSGPYVIVVAEGFGKTRTYTDAAVNADGVIVEKEATTQTRIQETRDRLNSSQKTEDQ